MPERSQATEIPSLTIEYRTELPMEVAEFAESLHALADEFRDFNASPNSATSDVKLYVREIKKGSIVAVLEPLHRVVDAVSPVATAVFSDIKIANELIKFGQYLKGMFESLKHQGISNLRGSRRRSSENVRSIFRPIAKDPGGTVKLSIVGDHNNVYVINADSKEVRRVMALEPAARLLDEVARQIDVQRNKVRLVWDRVGRDGTGKDDRVVISAIDPKPRKCIFEDLAIRASIVRDSANILRHAYIVDAVIERKSGRISRYRIIKLHSRLSLD
jgi:hypothetical protein